MDLTLTIPIFFFLFLGGIFVDLDMQNSTIQKWLEIIFSLGIIIAFTYYYLLKSDALFPFAFASAFILFLIQLLHHRGIMHSLMALIILSIPLALINIPIGIAFGFGFLTHLLLDGELKVM